MRCEAFGETLILPAENLHFQISNNHLIGIATYHKTMILVIILRRMPCLHTRWLLNSSL